MAIKVGDLVRSDANRRRCVWRVLKIRPSLNCYSGYMADLALVDRGTSSYHQSARIGARTSHDLSHLHLEETAPVGEVKKVEEKKMGSTGSDIMKSLDTLRAAREKMKAAINKRETVTLTHEECAEITRHLDWLSGERESLLTALAPYDD